MRAIISVANRDGLTQLASEMQTHNVTIFSTGGTRNFLTAEGIPAESVSTLTRFPEILDGRVKTLHPAILAGILARRDLSHHADELAAHDIEPIDIVVVNLYPFAATVARPDTTLTEALEQIDIGGVTLVRAAAKNFQDVIVLVRPEDYAPVMQEWREQGEVSIETRRRLAAIAFQHTATYDTTIAEYLRGASGELFPEELTLPLERVQTLRYGENPHQQATFYRWSGATRAATTLPTVAGAEVLHGKELSFNNLLDLDAALGAVQDFTAPTIAIIKHTNPCGLACDDVLVEAYKKAHGGDPISAYGGIIGCNRPIDEAVAHEISQLFYEAVIAPEFTPGALNILRHKKNLRLLATHCPMEPKAVNTQLLQAGRPDVHAVSGGILLQTPDVDERETEYNVVTEREPTLEEVTDLMFAWKVVRRVKSNAIVLARKLTVVGVGAGQMNRVTSVQLAVTKAGERARGAVLASDAYFPFSDGVETAAKGGVTAIIQPGGSIRDEETIRMANQHAIAMIFTGKRHFRH
ncbi:MAG TPA: bifunctional phosphoribosylaminoimidazolecarboxamide formyltransferase/IMP cyclohydrolase [Ktedonobacteraceae bacterium]|nr:bifunctional phosphoribosylaminoimidazolecarboxamide formyltransferase/IMP cyclohydrolase [Ktedonobacteraceae bacterium]